MRITALISIGIVLAAAPVSTQSSGDRFELRTLSTRADMVSGGDVLIQITTPPSAALQIALTVNGREPRGELREMTSGTLIARLTDLRLGPNDIAVGLRGQKAAVHLSVVNHPISGPVFSGRHQTPFSCETEAFGLGEPVDTTCTAATRVDYFYRSTGAPPNANPFKPYDVAAPRPEDLATTTTLDGKTVPYIVRREMGTIRSHDDDATIVLDRHNLIYAYGPLNDFEAALQARGVRQGEPLVPGPHVHHYHQAWDGAEVEVVRHFDWRISPLRPTDVQFEGGR